MIEASLLCLALNVYWEARSEPIVGQFAVAEVTLLRSEQSGRPICEEVYRPYQFSWTLLPREQLKIQDSRAWGVARAVAAASMKKPRTFVRDATHFHADYVQPYWASALCRITQIGRHIFYRACTEEGDKKKVLVAGN